MLIVKMLLQRPINSVIFLFVILFTGCSKEKNLPQLDLGLTYYPLKVASVIVYDVDSTVYDDFTNTSTLFKFQLKDSVTSTFLDALNNNVFRIERYKKIANANWVFQKVITRNIINNRAEEFLENKRFVRLVFPTQLGTKWNGNLYNNQATWPYEITAADQSETIGGKNIDSTLTVSQYNEVNLIREDIYREIYAKHIGLVGKNVTAVDKDITSGKIKKGLIFKMTLSSSK